MVEIKTIFKNIAEIEGYDAIVNCSNEKLSSNWWNIFDKSVNRAIHNQAGRGLRSECKSIGGCNVGDAVVTSAYNMPCKKIIHTVGPVWKGDDSETFLLENCYLNVLDIARQEGLKKIIFPAISAGNHEYPKDIVSQIAVETVKTYCEEYPSAFDEICFAFNSESLMHEYEIALAENKLMALEYIELSLEIKSYDIAYIKQRLSVLINEEFKSKDTLRKIILSLADGMLDDSEKYLAMLFRHKQIKKLIINCINSKVPNDLNISIKNIIMKHSINEALVLKVDVEGFSIKGLISHFFNKYTDKMDSENVIEKDILELLRGVLYVADDMITENKIQDFIQRVINEQQELIGKIICDAIMKEYHIEIVPGEIRVVR